jgi:hypothetical protein
MLPLVFGGGPSVTMNAERLLSEPNGDCTDGISDFVCHA